MVAFEVRVSAAHCSTITLSDNCVGIWQMTLATNQFKTHWDKMEIEATRGRPEVVSLKLFVFRK